MNSRHCSRVNSIVSCSCSPSKNRPQLENSIFLCGGSLHYAPRIEVPHSSLSAKNGMFTISKYQSRPSGSLM